MTPPRRRHRTFSMSGSHWRSDGQPKVGYPSQAAALDAADHQATESGIALRVYRCDFCSAWHMGRGKGREDD
jgi:hypothetical protein